MNPLFDDPIATLLSGDCIAQMRAMPADSVHSAVTDPPYHFASIVKRFGGANAAPARIGETGAYERASRGFMGKEWDGGDIAFRPETWAEVLRVLKPGGHLLAFGSSKGSHRMVCAIEDAGFEIRDTIMWIYGTGFPKSHNQEGFWEGWGSALKPAFEPSVMARKPLIGTIAANLSAFGTGAINIDGCRVEADLTEMQGRSGTAAAGNVILGAGIRNPDGGVWEPNSDGRWPANVLHDGSDEVVSAFPHTSSGKPGVMRLGVNTGAAYGAESRKPGTLMTGFGDSGSAARFFYSAKATKAERAGSKHPTVKPIALMRYLCRLVTPPGGTVLDPFAGTGTTGAAALAEGFNVTLIEREIEYQQDIRRRLGLPEPEPVGVFA